VIIDVKDGFHRVGVVPAGRSCWRGWTCRWS